MTYFTNLLCLDLVIANFFLINAVDENSYKSLSHPWSFLEEIDG